MDVKDAYNLWIVQDKIWSFPEKSYNKSVGCDFAIQSMM